MDVSLSCGCHISLNADDEADGGAAGGGLDGAEEFGVAGRKGGTPNSSSSAARLSSCLGISDLGISDLGVSDAPMFEPGGGPA
jgi:hypothetical protein